MAVQILDARSGVGLYLEIGTPDKILSNSAAWIASLRVPSLANTTPD